MRIEMPIGLAWLSLLQCCYSFPPGRGGVVLENHGVSLGLPNGIRRFGRSRLVPTAILPPSPAIGPAGGGYGGGELRGATHIM